MRIALTELQRCFIGKVECGLIITNFPICSLDTIYNPIILMRFHDNIELTELR